MAKLILIVRNQFENEQDRAEVTALLKAQCGNEYYCFVIDQPGMEFQFEVHGSGRIEDIDLERLQKMFTAKQDNNGSRLS